MVNAAIIGLGWWGKTLVEAVEHSDLINVVAGTTRTVTEETEEFAKTHGFALKAGFEDILADDGVDAVILATPHTKNVEQIIQAAKRGKHVFCEKPLSLTRQAAQQAIDAAADAGITVGLGYNRRFHPTMVDLKERINSGQLGIIEHFECTMTFPNALALKPEAWRAQAGEAPCGGLTPLGVHMVDAAIDLFGDVDEVFCQSFKRAVEIDNDDTTSILFKMKDGMTGYLATLTATTGLFRLQVYGSKGWVRIDGMTHIAGASSEERRTRLFGTCQFKPIKGPGETWEAEPIDLPRASLEAFAAAVEGGEPYPIAPAEMVHGAAVTEAIIRSSQSHKPESIV
jgi:predicted dehydrogenase